MDLVTGVQTCALPISRHGSIWSALGSGVAGVPAGAGFSYVAALAVAGGDLYAGGSFTQIGRAAGWGRGENLVVAVSFKKKNRDTSRPVHDVSSCPVVN